MKNNLEIFKGMSEHEIKTALLYLESFEKKYKKNEMIFNYGDKPKYIGIINSGSINIFRDDFLGNRNVIAHIEKNGVFGEVYAFAQMPKYKVNVQAVEDCEITFLPCEKIISSYKKMSSFHEKLIINILYLISKRNIMLNQKIDCVTKKSVREKIVFYLLSEYDKTKNNKILIPFNREELSEYLNVNRSSLSRELGILKDEGFLNYKKNEFEIFDIEILKDILYKED